MCDKVIPETSDSPKIFSNISELFNLMLTDNNIVVQECALETFTHFVKNTKYQVIHHQSIDTNARLQKIVLNFLERKTSDDITCHDKFLVQLGQTSFEHRCLQDASVLPLIKRVKLDGSSIYDVLQRLKIGVEDLKDVSCNTALSSENVDVIKCIISSLQRFVWWMTVFIFKWFKIFVN